MVRILTIIRGKLDKSAPFPLRCIATATHRLPTLWSNIRPYFAPIHKSRANLCTYVCMCDKLVLSLCRKSLFEDTSQPTVLSSASCPYKRGKRYVTVTVTATTSPLRPCQEISLLTPTLMLSPWMHQFTCHWILRLAKNTATVTVTDNSLRYSSYRKAVPFPLTHKLKPTAHASAQHITLCLFIHTENCLGPCLVWPCQS